MPPEEIVADAMIAILTGSYAKLISSDIVIVVAENNDLITTLYY